MKGKKVNWSQMRSPLKYSSPMIQQHSKNCFRGLLMLLGFVQIWGPHSRMPCLIPTVLLCWWLSELEGEMRRLWAVGPCWSCFARPWKQCCSLARPVLSASLSPNTYTHTHNSTPSREEQLDLARKPPKDRHTMSLFILVSCDLFSGRRALDWNGQGER